MADDGLSAIVAGVMGRGDVRAAVEAIYGEIGAELAAIRPRCEMSGRCCRFEEYGHRLYVTTMELAVFAACARDRPDLAGYAAKSDGSGCRYQDSRMCMAHAIRPMGCRLFFCDASRELALQALYERMHQKLKQAHGQLAVPYRYIEWRSGLEVIGGLLLV